MARLTKRNADGTVGISELRYYNYNDFQKIGQKLAEYEDLEEQGLLLRLPCKVGDAVYLICSRYTKCTQHDEEFNECLCQGCEDECDSHEQYYIRKNSAVGFEKIIQEIENRIFAIPNEVKEYPMNAGLAEAYKKSIEIVKQTVAEYNNGWIPCSKKLPENNRPVLCWVRSTTIASGETYIIGSCDNGFWFLQTYEIGHHHFPVEDYKVISWQPLPEPYKGE